MRFFECGDEGEKNGGAASDTSAPAADMIGSNLVDCWQFSSEVHCPPDGALLVIFTIAGARHYPESQHPRCFMASKAAQHGNRYAVHPNSKYGYETTWFGIGSDCTNFASQILYACGVAMDTSYNTNEGWWWRAANQRSVSWIQAATFANALSNRKSM